MVRKRFEYIDFLRAVSIIGVIAIHTLSFNLIDSTHRFIWNYLNFVVVAFIFCSGYVLTVFYKDKLNSLSEIIPWYKKRLVRLLIPFYLYLAVHYLLLILFPNFFSGFDLQKSPIYILKSIFLVGGANIGWLPLLFIQLTLLFPLFARGFTHRKILLIYSAFSITVTLVFTIITFPYEYYRTVMFIPWSLVLLCSIFIAIKEQSDINVSQSIKRYLKWASITGIIFVFLYMVYSVLGRKLGIIDHKYPPDFYCLSYSLLVTFILLVLSRFPIIKHPHIFSKIKYVSDNSYQLFFIHYIFLDLVLKVTKGAGFWSAPIMQFVLVLSGSFAICFLFSNIQIFFKQRQIDS